MGQLLFFSPSSAHTLGQQVAYFRTVICDYTRVLSLCMFNSPIKIARLIYLFNSNAYANIASASPVYSSLKRWRNHEGSRGAVAPMIKKFVSEKRLNLQ